MIYVIMFIMRWDDELCYSAGDNQPYCSDQFRPNTMKLPKV